MADGILGPEEIAARERGRRFTVVEGVGLAVVLLTLFLASSHSFLLFHSLVELFSVAVAWSVFVLAWNTRTMGGNPFLLLVGIVYLFLGGLDLLHTLAYKGLGVFETYDADLPTQLWISARFMEAGALLGGLLFMRRIKNGTILFFGMAGITALVLVLIFTGVFPVCFVEGQGLTPFKIGSEYCICLMLAASGVVAYYRRSEFIPSTFAYLLVSIAAAVLSELAFTFYVSVYGISNVAGHLFKLISFYFLYKALVENSLHLPFSQLFQSLRESEAARRDVDRIMRHELKSPLVAIIGLPRLMLEEGGVTDHQKKLLGLIEDAGKRMQRMVDASLDVYHMEQGTFTWIPEPVDILAVLDDVRREAESNSLDPAVTVVLDGETVRQGDVHEIMAEPKAVRMALANILLNAMEAEQGRDEVAVEIASGERTLVTIRNGTPVPEAVRSRFFEKYVTQGKSSGTGLGTHVARLAARALGGDVEMSTSQERGTSVVITLPGSRKPQSP